MRKVWSGLVDECAPRSRRPVARAGREPSTELRRSRRSASSRSATSPASTTTTSPPAPSTTLAANAFSRTAPRPRRDARHRDRARDRPGRGRAHHRSISSTTTCRSSSTRSRWRSNATTSACISSCTPSSACAASARRRTCAASPPTTRRTSAAMSRCSSRGCTSRSTGKRAPTRSTRCAPMSSSVLGDVRAATATGRRCSRRCDRCAPTSTRHRRRSTPTSSPKARAFLQWLGDEHFTFLAYRAYDLGADDELRPVPGYRPRTAAQRAGGRVGELCAPPGRRPRQGARAHAAGAHQGERPLDCAPADVPRLRRREALRRGRQRDRRAPVPRPLHVERVHVEPDGRARASPQDRARSCGAPASSRRATTRRTSRRSSRPTRATTSSRSTSTTSTTSRSAILRAAGTPAGAPVRAPRAVRPVRVVSRVPPA